MNDAHLFKAAREVSFKSDYSGGGRPRIGCVIAYKGSILAKGFNTDKTHSVQAHYNELRYKDSGNRYLPAKGHSECLACAKIKYLDIDFSRVHVYVYRETRDGHIAMARPCPACMKAIRDLGIKYVHYTSNEGYCKEELV